MLVHRWQYMMAHLAAPAVPHRSTALWPPGDATTAAMVGREQDLPGRYRLDALALSPVNIVLAVIFSVSAGLHASVAFARPSIYAAKRFSCGPGAETRDPTKQVYIKMSVYDPVVLAARGGMVFRKSEGLNENKGQVSEEALYLRLITAQGTEQQG